MATNTSTPKTAIPVRWGYFSTESLETLLQTIIDQTDQVETLLTSIDAGTPTTVPKLDTLTGAAVQVDYAHHETHDGNYYRIGANFATLAAATNYDVLVVVAAGKELHFNMEIEGNTENGYTLYEFGDGSSSTGGSTGTIVCKNRQRKGTPTAAVTIGVTPNLTGATKLTEKRVGSGRSTGGDAGSSEEWILGKGKSYIVRFSNYATPTGAMTGWWKLSWYEE